MDSPAFDDGTCRKIKQPFWDLEVDNETKHERVRRHATAKSICSDCPVVNACLRWAESNPTLIVGVWGGKVYASIEFKYPRCEVCDKPLATTMTAVYRMSSGYALPHPKNLAVCAECGVVVGLPAVEEDSKLDGVRKIVSNTRMYKITSTVSHRPTN